MVSMVFHSQLPALPSSEAVKTEVTNALRNAGGDLSLLPWKERPDIYGRAAHDVVQKLKFGNNRSKHGRPKAAFAMSKSF